MTDDFLLCAACRSSGVKTPTKRQTDIWSSQGACFVNDALLSDKQAADAACRTANQVDSLKKSTFREANSKAISQVKFKERL